MKKCKRCGHRLSATKYRPGRSKCKKCEIAEHAEWIKKNHKHSLQYMQKWRDDHRLNVSRSAKRHYQKNSGKIKLDVKKWRVKNPEKKLAHGAVERAVASKRIRKPKRCSRCNKYKPVEGHHRDYSRQLDVQWLCKQCHVAVDRRNE